MLQKMILTALGLAWALCAAATASDAPPPAAGPRVVTFAPNITETVFAMGAGDRVVGVTEWCRYPPEATTRRTCGGWANPNLEVLTALRPDLILVQGANEKLRRFAVARDLRVVSVDMDSLDEIMRETRRIGELLGRPDAATSLTARMRSRLDAVARRVDRTSTPTVFLSVGRTPGRLDGLMTVSGGSFLDDALRLAGGRNVFADVRTPYPRVSKESLLARRPEVILELAPGLGGGAEVDAHELRADWQGLTAIPAVREGRIHVLTGDHLLLAGPRIVRTVEQMHAALSGTDRE